MQQKTDGGKAHGMDETGEELSALRRELATLESISDPELSVLDFQSLSEELIKRLIRSLDLDSGAVLLMKEETGALELALYYGIPAVELPTYQGEVTGAFATRVAQESRTLVAEDINADPQLVTHYTRKHKIRSMLGTPLFIGGHLAGVIHVAATSPRTFSPREVRLLEIVADRMARALDYSRLSLVYADIVDTLTLATVRHIQQLRQSASYIDIVDRLQMAFLPQVPSTIGRSQCAAISRPATAAARLGGDFYDAFEVPGGYVLVIGDVSGKGIPATNLVALVRGTVRAFAYENPDPSVILTRTNQSVCHQLLPNEFVTAAVFLLDEDLTQVTVANAGHPPAILLTEGEPQRMPYGDIPLGVAEVHRYDSVTLPLSPEFVLLLYTDGLIEARRQGEVFGEEQLVSLVVKLRNLGVAGLANSVTDAVQSYAHGSLTDDVAMLVLKAAPKASGALPSTETTEDERGQLSE